MAICAQAVRNLYWGKSYLWDMRFPDDGSYSSLYERPPNPPFLFSDWFPAYTVQEPVYNVAIHPIRTAVFDFSIPKSIGYSDLTVSFYDTEWGLLKDWLWLWVQHMFSMTLGGQGGLATRTLVECVRPVQILKLTNQRSISAISSYWVFPSGSLISFLNSESGPMDYTATFTIVGGMFTNNVPASTPPTG